MSKYIIVLEIGGRQSEDMDEAKWAVKNVVEHVGGYNEAFVVAVDDDTYDKLSERADGETGSYL